MEKHSVSRMIGAPPGYVGYDEGGQLTEAVRRRPYSVVLLDEIEKAHPDVFNVLLQILDDGRLTDGKGRTVDFRNAVVIMTSNIASRVIQELGEGERARMLELVERELQGPLPAGVPQPRRRGAGLPPPARPSTSGRSSASSSHRLNALLADHGITRSRPNAPPSRVLADEGFDPDFGARPLKRTIQRLVQDPLARMVLAGEVRRRRHGSRLRRERRPAPSGIRRAVAPCGGLQEIVLAAFDRPGRVSGDHSSSAARHQRRRRQRSASHPRQPDTG